VVDLGTLRPNTGVTRAFQYALLIFTLTVLIGLVNATKIFGTLSRDTILTHVHSGTLGFITMGAFGIALWIFGGGVSPAAARNVLISALATAAYILAFWSGNLPARAIFGTIELVLIVAWWWWIFSQVRAIGFGRLDHPRLSVFLAFTTLVIGSTLGVTIQVLLATGQVLPAPGQGPDLLGGHAVAQVSGYLVLMAVGIGEWRLRADRGARSRSGLTQSYLLFLAGLAAAIGVLLGIVPLLLVTNLFFIVAVAIFVVRSRRGILGAGWVDAGPARHFAVAVIFLVVAVTLLTVLVASFAQAQGDPTRIPLGLIIAYDHATFIGVLTNILFGTAVALAGSRGSRWDHATFWLLNVGLVGFLGVLVFAGSGSELVRYTATVMGLGAVIGIVTLLVRLGSAAEPTPAPAAMRA
jgi:hypothetical protein